MTGILDMLSKLGLKNAAPASPSAPGPLEILQSNQPEKQYRGRKVVWDVTLQTLNTDINPGVVFVFTQSAAASANIWLILPEKECPEIFEYRSGTRLRVVGEIKTIQGEDIYLENCTVEFQDPPGFGE